MSRVEQKAVRARLVPAALGLGIALAVTGCGAGMQSQTAIQVAAVNGASGKVGAIEIRDAQFAFPAQHKYPAKSNPSLLISLINSGAQDDQLVAITSDATSAPAEVKGGNTIPAGFVLRAEANEAEHGTASSGSATPTSTSGSATPTSGAATSTSATPTSATSPSTSAADTSKLKVGSVMITLVGLKRELWPGQTIPVTFSFAKAGSVTLQVPIAADEKPRTAQPTTGGHGGSGGH
ncbi:hypothetical protein N8J89_01950 [Crossiella sp. CA-258035]|uniref:hypothetical protein n=1 Tax=Crossiella sp. CA-258035 TaxID=2981138 RepID=UPI0024BD4272|nr:hypothetical protein [Crossiella sp. CA-258035]WHT19866.1 hypothetical protein N8J89_01950 [Crossiella sp. CA-258035]